MKAEMRPTHDRVIIRHLNEEEVTKGGIVISTSTKRKPQEGVVFAVGKGKEMPNGSISPLSVKVGDRVIFSKHSGSQIKINEEEFLVVREEEILCVIED
jgi:chaperonin GroES